MSILMLMVILNLIHIGYRLQQQLIVNGINTQTPEMPDAYEPDYQKMVERF